MKNKKTKIGKFIVIYGANNVGKTTQAKLLVKRLRGFGYKVKQLKYAIYSLKPTGPILNKYLREGLKMDEYEAQAVYAQNRRDYEPKLKKMLNDGIWVVAEDYIGTGICWGVTHGVSIDKVIKLNEDLLKEDLAILVDGEMQFKESIENGHHNEDSGIWEKGRDVHRMVGKMFNWEKVNANQSVDTVANDIWEKIKKITNS